MENRVKNENQSMNLGDSISPELIEIRKQASEAIGMFNDGALKAAAEHLVVNNHFLKEFKQYASDDDTVAMLRRRITAMISATYIRLSQRAINEIVNSSPVFDLDEVSDSGRRKMKVAMDVKAFKIPYPLYYDLGYSLKRKSNKDIGLHERNAAILTYYDGFSSSFKIYDPRKAMFIDMNSNLFFKMTKGVVYTRKYLEWLSLTAYYGNRVQASDKHGQSYIVYGFTKHCRKTSKDKTIVLYSGWVNGELCFWDCFGQGLFGIKLFIVGSYDNFEDIEIPLINPWVTTTKIDVVKLVSSNSVLKASHGLLSRFINRMKRKQMRTEAAMKY